MLPGPVFYFEMLTLSRRARYYAMRFAYGFLLLALITQLNPEFYRNYGDRPGNEVTIQEMASIGQAIFSTFAWTQSIAILLLTPVLVAGAIVDEKQRKTLPYLLSSCLTSSEIVLGKLCARLLLLGVLLATGLPILSMLGFFGGVDPNDVLFFSAASVSTTFLLAAFSIFVSVHARRSREANSISYVMMGAWLFLPAILEIALPSAGGYWATGYHLIQPVNRAIGRSSPVYFLVNSSRFLAPGVWLENTLYLIGSQILYGSVFVIIAVLRLRRVYQREGGRGGRLFAFASRRSLRILRRPECGDDAMLWKERYVSRSSLLSRGVAAFVYLGVVGLLAYGTIQLGEPAFQELRQNGYGYSSGSYHNRQDMNVYLRLMIALTYACWAIGVASTASSCLTSEREEDTWISLLTTPLTPWEILRAKFFGALWSTRWIGVIWAMLFATGLASGSIHPVAILSTGTSTIVYLWFACSLGLTCSLRARTSTRAMAYTMVILLFCNCFYLMMFIPLFMTRFIETSLILIGVTPFVEGLGIVSYADMAYFTDPSSISGASWRSLIEFVTLSILSVTCYGVAALALSWMTVAQFDDALDRPTSWGFDNTPKTKSLRIETADYLDNETRFDESENIPQVEGAPAE